MARFVILTLLWTLLPQAATADIIVDVQDASISAGGIGFVDVLISSTNTNPLQFASYEFLISGSILNGALRFRSPQLSTEQSVMGPPEYMFFGDTDPGNFSAVRNPLNFANLTGSDSTGSIMNIAGDLNTGVFKLLARLELEHVTATPLAAVNDTFSLQLINNTGIDPFDPFDDSTLFLDDTLSVQDIDASSFASIGTITITSAAAAVPEPSTFGLLAVVAVGGLCRRIRRRSATS